MTRDSTWQVRLLPGAESDLEGLARVSAARLAGRLLWLSHNADQAQHRALRRELAGLFKLRVGDLRVIYELARAERVIIVHAIGHRREIYR